MICSRCGYVMDDSQTVCPKCGAEIESEYKYDTDGVYEESYSEDTYVDEAYGELDYDDEPDDQDDLYIRTRNMRKQKKNGNFKQIIWVIVIVIVLAAAVSMGIFAFRLYRNHQLQRLTEAYAAYEQVLSEYQIEDAQYKELLNDAKIAIENQDAKAAGTLLDTLEDTRIAIEQEYEHKKMLLALKTEYDEAFSKLRVLDEYKETYDAAIAALDKAIVQSDEKSFNSLKKQLESLKINLKTANQQAIKSLKNEIARLDVAGAKKEDTSLLESYKTGTQAALDADDYATALDVLSIWKTDAERISEDVKKRNAAKKESIKKEQERLESESREAESQKPQVSGDYILSQSSSRILTESDLQGLSANDLMIARNEIYARHGRKFKNAQLQAYFNSKSWYRGTIEPERFDSSVLSNVERTNINFISAHE